ncbi:hypothetical protein FRC17_004639 [Serendipita sp. 399]|nr:hypothetical protein FRC17_004639 [Serendipita sp. 399]
MDARVVRIYGSTNPVKLLKACQNLEALRVQCDGFRKTIASLPIITHKLTHLHLEAVRDALPQDIHRLDLPELVYAKLMLRLNGRTRQGVHAFPLEMHMPNVKTLYIGGLVKEGWGTELECFILSAKNSLVNLLLAYDTRSTFSFRKLIEFSRLSTLGLYPQGPSPSNLDAVHLPTPLTLVVLRLDDYDWVRSLNRKEQMNSFTQLLTVLAASITDLVIPFKWRELEDLWVQWCDKFGPTDGDDPLPCPWSWLDQIDRDRASPILDRDQVSLRDDDGAAFASRMRECTEKFMDRRREQALSLQILSLQGALPPVAGPVTTSEFGIEPTSIPATDVPLAYPLLPDSVSS